MVGTMAVRPIEPEDDLATIVATTRREMISTGEDKAPASGIYEPPFGPDARAVIMALVRDGTYRKAARRVARTDPQLADV